MCQPTETEECRDVPREVCRPERECAVVERSRPSRECSIVPEEVCEELERQVVKEVCVPTPRQECRYANIYRISFKHELIPFITRTVPKERCGVERGKPICSLVAVEDCANEVQPAAQQECREIPREVCQDVVREECDDDVTAAASGLDSVINAGIEGNEIDSEIVGQALQLVRVRLKPRRFYH